MAENPAEPTSPCDSSCVHFDKCYMDGCAEKGVNHDGVYYEKAGEVRVVDPETGGEKGSKLARFDLIPAGALWQLAEHYGRGAQKYDDNNWRRGYAWSLSYAALMRHAWSFWNGEDIDPETGSPHMVAVAWHAFSLLTFMAEGLGRDDRQVKA